MIKKTSILSLFLLLFLTSCSTTWSHKSGNNSNLNTDHRYCGARANSVAPNYICRNPFMCAPDEFNIAIQSLARNQGVFDQCMIKKGYSAQ